MVCVACDGRGEGVVLHWWFGRGVLLSGCFGMWVLGFGGCSGLWMILIEKGVEMWL